MRGAAAFGRSHASITLSEGGSRATMGTNHALNSAASKAVMRAGRHYAQFTVMSGLQMYFGVIRPGWDVEGGKQAYNVGGHCFYFTAIGCRCPQRHDWEGMRNAMAKGDRIGMLLDLDQGSMTVYKNDERLGVMATGLSGEYSWAVSLDRYGCVHIEPADAPTSPTAAELAQVAAYEVARYVNKSDDDY
jgi:hypothetical protein